MNEGGWNLVEAASSHSPKSSDSESGKVEITEEELLGKNGGGAGGGIGGAGLKKEASFAWRGGQERQTTGEG